MNRVLYRLVIGTTRTEGAVQIGLGETIRKNKWGRNRKYIVAFSAADPEQPLVEFVAADDYEQTRALVAVIRAATAGGACTPSVTPSARSTRNAFEPRPTTSGSYTQAARNKIALVAREDGDQTILNHALIQSRRRHRT